MASLDVKSLFTKVPIDHTMEIVRRRLEEMRESEEGNEVLDRLTSLTTDAFLTLLRLVVDEFYFTWHKKLYHQKSGLPMGSRLSPVLANIYMEEVENTVLRAFPIALKMYVRFVDNIFLVYDSSKMHLQELLDVFNDQHPDIKLTCEMEEDQQLPYLDILVKRNNIREARRGEQRSFSLSIHRKSTHSHKYLNFALRHPLSLKRNTFRGHYLRN